MDGKYFNIEWTRGEHDTSFDSLNSRRGVLCRRSAVTRYPPLYAVALCYVQTRLYSRSRDTTATIIIINCP